MKLTTESLVLLLILSIAFLFFSPILMELPNTLNKAVEIGKVK